VPAKPSRPPGRHRKRCLSTPWACSPGTFRREADLRRGLARLRGRLQRVLAVPLAAHRGEARLGAGRAGAGHRLRHRPRRRGGRPARRRGRPRPRRRLRRADARDRPREGRRAAAGPAARGRRDAARADRGAVRRRHVGARNLLLRRHAGLRAPPLGLDAAGRPARDHGARPQLLRPDARGVRRGGARGAAGRRGDRAVAADRRPGDVRRGLRGRRRLGRDRDRGRAPAVRRRRRLGGS